MQKLYAKLCMLGKAFELRDKAAFPPEPDLDVLAGEETVQVQFHAGKVPQPLQRHAVGLNRYGLPVEEMRGMLSSQ